MARRVMRHVMRFGMWAGLLGLLLVGCQSEPEFIAAGTGNETWMPVVQEFDGLPMVKVPAGCFSMGRDSGPDEEVPVRRVCLTEFWISQTEITNMQYTACVDAGACTPPVDTAFYSAPSFASYPVVNVTWDQADAYARWRGGSLPTEAQWEYAARGPQGWMYPWGEDAPDCDRANVNACVGGLAPVGDAYRTGGASWVGALDMIGNAWEWTSGWFDRGYYVHLSDGDVNPAGPAQGQMRVLRGGAWNEPPDRLTTTFRSRHTPAAWSAQRGFRIVLAE